MLGARTSTSAFLLQPQKLLARPAVTAAARVQRSAAAATKIHRPRKPVSDQRGAAQDSERQRCVEDSFFQAAFL